MLITLTAPNLAAILQQYYFAKLAILQQYCQSCCKVAAMQPSISNIAVIVHQYYKCKLDL